MPMGWSWALLFCHGTVSRYIEQGLRDAGLACALVGHRLRPGPVAADTVVAAPYVDNANLLTLLPGVRRQAYRAV
eukprot:5150235-Lingulodinium_polyedra.AAC.1